MIILGCAAAVSAAGGHELFACELSQAPRQAAAATAASALIRKPARLPLFERPRIERRAQGYVPALPSRRVILQ